MIWFLFWYSAAMLAIGSAIGYVLQRWTDKAIAKERQDMAIKYAELIEKAYSHKERANGS